MKAQTPPPSQPIEKLRHLALQGAVNFRDIGGYLAAQGRTVRWHRIYRSAQINRLTDADLAVLDARRILTVVDLREASEIALAPDRLPKGASTVCCPATNNPIENWNQMLVSATSGVPFMCAFYSDIQGLATRFKPFFQTLIDLPEDRALLLHCMAGKDRTGIGIALLLLALGVPHGAIMEDYLLTNKYGLKTFGASASHLETKKLPDEVVRDLLAARPEYLDAFFNALEAHHGTREQFLVQALGLTPEKIALLREKFTE